MPDSPDTSLPIPPPPHSLAALEAVVGGYQAAIVAHAAYVAGNARAGIVSELLEINLATQALWRLVAIRKALRDLMNLPAAPPPPTDNAPSPQCPRCPHEPAHPCPQSSPGAPVASPDSSHASHPSHQSHPTSNPADALGNAALPSGTCPPTRPEQSTPSAPASLGPPASRRHLLSPDPSVPQARHSSITAAAPTAAARPHSHFNWPPPTRFFACHLDRKIWFDPSAPDPAIFDSDDPTDPDAPRAARPRPATILASRAPEPDSSRPPIPPLPYAVKTQHIYYPSTPLLDEIHDAWHYDARPFLYPVEHIHETAAGRPISRPVPDPAASAAALAPFLDFDPSSLDDPSASSVPSIHAAPSVPAVPTVPAFRLPGLWLSPAINSPVPAPANNPAPMADAPPPPPPDHDEAHWADPPCPASTRDAHPIPPPRVPPP